MTLILFFIMMIVFLNFIKPKKKSSILGIQLCNALNSNQFKKSVLVGELDEVTSPSGSVMEVRYNPEATSTLTLEPGQGVKLIDLGATDPNGKPIIDERTADADPYFGLRTFTTKQGEDSPDDIVKIAMEGAIIWMKASEAMPRNSLVAEVIGTVGDIAIRTTEEILGITLDRAAAADDLVRVKITARGFAELALYELST